MLSNLFLSKDKKQVIKVQSAAKKSSAKKEYDPTNKVERDLFLEQCRAQISKAEYLATNKSVVSNEKTTNNGDYNPEVIPLKKKKYYETVTLLNKLLHKADYADNIKADTLRKLLLFIEQDENFKLSEKEFIDFLKSDQGIKLKTKIVKNLTLQIIK
jgi:hypothetical protein